MTGYRRRGGADEMIDLPGRQGRGALVSVELRSGRRTVTPRGDPTTHRAQARILAASGYRENPLKIAALKRAVRAAAGGGWNSLAADRALHDTTGFQAAWGLTDKVPGWLHRTNGALFWGALHEISPRTIVEIGSYQGRSTVLLGLAMKHLGQAGGRVTAIDPHTGDRQHLDQLGLASLPSLDLFKLHIQGAGVEAFVDLKALTSDEVATDWNQPIDFLFVDGWHSYDAVYADACNFASQLTDKGIVCFDDYLHYADVRAAVDDACDKLGLHFYGVTKAHAWAGVPATPPAAVARVLRLPTGPRKRP